MEKSGDIEIKEAESGEEGVAIAVEHKPDVSLIDVRLPGMDGRQAAQEIKEKAPDLFLESFLSFSM